MSEPTPILYGVVDDKGKFHADNQELFKTVFLNLLNKTVELVARKRRAQRSIPQNNYYWAVVVKMVSEAMGLSKDETHNFLKANFNKEILIVNGKEYTKIRSTKDIERGDFNNEFIREIQQFAAEDLRIDIPDPYQVDP